MSSSERHLITIGQVMKPRGIKGELKIYPYTEQHCMEYYCKLPSVWIGKSANLAKEYQVIKNRIFKNFFLCCLNGVNTIEQAIKLKLNFLFIPKEQRAEIKKDEILLDDLLDSEVFNADGKKLGKVINFFHSGANGICEVVRLDNKPNFLFPVTSEVLIETDSVKKKLVINPLEGMLE